MKHTIPLKVAVAVIAVGLPFLFWFYYIDGWITNRPVTFMNGVNPMDLKLEKKTYYPGETPRFYSSFCKNREFMPSLQWVLADGVLQYYPAREGKVAAFPIGCYPKTGGLILVPLEKIPEDHEKTCDAYFTGEGRLALGGNRNPIVYPYKTEKFCIK